MKNKVFIFATLIFAVSVLAAVSSAQRRPQTETPIAGDFKITIRNTIAGQTSQSTTLIKGKRERTETSISSGSYNMTSVNITQCDMRRTIQVNDRVRKYLITTFDITTFDSDDASASSTGTTAAPAAGGAVKRGGVVNLIVNTVDTGERKEMFGFTARRFKRTTIMESSPDACYQQKVKIETDGWYINLEYGLNCGNSGSSYSGATAGATCRDRYVYKRTGPAHIGYPLSETTTMYGPDGAVMHTMTKEVVEISRQTQDAALFDIPAGYTAAQTQEEMYATSSSSDMTGMPSQQTGQPTTRPDASMASATASAPARIRVGVVQLNNKTKTSVSTDSLRDQLISALNGQGVEAVALNAISPSEAAVEAQAKQCAYILFTDIATLKTASAGKKIGGLLGRATGVGSGDTGKAEVRLDFRLLPTESASPKVQSTASAKEDTQEASLNTAIQTEAQAIAAALPRP